MRTLGRWLAVAILAAPGFGAELKQNTVNAWNNYARAAADRLETRADTGKPFLWADEDATRRQRIQNGEIVALPVVGHGTQNVPGGLIHDWIGAAFIPGITAADLLSLLRDYDNYKSVYAPVVIDSRCISCDAATPEFSMLWKRHVMMVTAAMQARYQVHDVALDARHGYSVIDAIAVQEIQNYGHPNEHMLPPDTGSGFIWRIRSIMKYEERDGGVYLEVEALALSRDMPASVQWMAAPVVHRLSLDSLISTLRQTREAAAVKVASAQREKQVHNEAENASLVTGN